MGRPPSKIHDPIGYDAYYAGNPLLGFIFWGIVILLVIKGCGGLLNQYGMLGLALVSCVMLGFG